jgi:hypothetical protein
MYRALLSFIASPQITGKHRPTYRQAVSWRCHKFLGLTKPHLTPLRFPRVLIESSSCPDPPAATRASTGRPSGSSGSSARRDRRDGSFCRCAKHRECPQSVAVAHECSWPAMACMSDLLVSLGIPIFQAVIMSPTLLTKETSVGLDRNDLVHGDRGGCKGSPTRLPPDCDTPPVQHQGRL